MNTEGNSNGFFSRFKGIFSSSETNQTTETLLKDEAYPLEESSGKTATEPSVRTYNYESVTEKEIPLRTVEVTAPAYSLPDQQDLDIRFATKFIGAGGKFIFAESIGQAIENIKLLKEDMKWSHVFTWENEIKDAFCEQNFQRGAIGYTIENSDAAISLCESLIAEDGTIILNPKQASRRRLTCFPKTHIIIADVAHLVGLETEGLERFYQMHKGELPSLIKLGNCNMGHFYDKQRLILNAEGPEDVYVILVDEIIPPSLRP